MFTALVDSYVSLGVTALESGDVDLAIRLLDAAIAEAERFDATGVDVARVARKIAALYLQYMIYDKAIFLLSRSLQILQQSGRAHMMECSAVLMDLAELALHLSRPRGANAYLNRAEKFLKNARQTGFDQSIHNRLQRLQLSIPVSYRVTRAQ